MRVVYRSFDNEQVSEQWNVVLTEMRKAGVEFHVNEGHRTFARQAYFYALYLRGQGSLAARPSPFAPHIRTGRIDHAIDFNNAGVVVAWLRQHAIQATTPVGGESWHVEVPAEDLRSYAAKHSDPTLRAGVINRDATRDLQRLLRARGLNDVPLNGRYDLATRRAVRRFQKAHNLKVDGIVGPQVWAELRRQ